MTYIYLDESGDMGFAFAKNSTSSIASRMHTSKSLNTKFDENITTQTTDKKFNVSIVKPCDDKYLQAVDFVSWALWQKYENGDESYSDIIADKIIQEYVMYE